MNMCVRERAHMKRHREESWGREGGKEEGSRREV